MGTEQNDEGQPGSGAAVDEITRVRPKEPKKYAVLLHNDDYTTMEFVLEVLKKFFRRSHDEAMAIMLKVHHAGHGVAGIYSHEVAETKAMQVGEHAQTSGFPLRASIEPAD